MTSCQNKISKYLGLEPDKEIFLKKFIIHLCNLILKISLELLVHGCFYKCVKHLNKNKISGDIAEFGAFECGNVNTSLESLHLPHFKEEIACI